MQRIVFLTDLHEGLSKIDYDQHYENLRTIVYPQLEHCQLLVLGGDFYDTLVTLNSQASIVALTIINDLLELSEAHQFYIRVLQGTYSHDRDQLKSFLTNLTHTNDLLNGIKRVDVVMNIKLEEFPSLGLKVGYIPDDLPNESNWDVFCKQLEDAHWKTVDVLVHHGYFQHLLGRMPAHIIPKNTLSYSQVKSRVKGVVLNGHVHTPSVYEIIISGGSFERFRHGEEEDKGFFIIHRDPDHGTYRFEFIPNTKATLFKSLNLTRYTDEKEALCTYIAWLQELRAQVPSPKKIYVNIVISDPVIRVALERYTKETDRFVVFSNQDPNDKTASLEDPVIVLEDLTPINESNLVEQIILHVERVHHQVLTPEDVQEVLSGGTAA